MPEIFRWLLDHSSALPVVVGIAYWVLSALRGAAESTKQTAPPQPRPPITPAPLNAPLQRGPTLGGPQSPLGQSSPPSTASTQAASRPTFADQALERLQQRFASNAGKPEPTAPTSKSTQSMGQMRAESDRQYAAALATSSAEQVVIDADVAAKKANKPGFVETLGGGDGRKGSLIAAIVLSQALDRRRPMQGSKRSSPRNH